MLILIFLFANFEPLKIKAMRCVFAILYPLVIQSGIENFLDFNNIYFNSDETRKMTIELDLEINDLSLEGTKNLLRIIRPKWEFRNGGALLFILEKGSIQNLDIFQS